MSPLMIKILAVGLTLSQLFTKPVDQFKVKFDPQADRAEIQQILNDGCTYIVTQSGADKINFEVLFTGMIANLKFAKSKLANDTPPPDDFHAPPNIQTQPDAASTSSKDINGSTLLSQLNVEELYSSYKFFCKGQKSAGASLVLGDFIAYYNKTMENLPDAAVLKGMKLKESTLVLDKDGNRFTEIYADNNRRRWVPISEIPDNVQKAFVAAEDKRFYQHAGIDPHGILRALANSVSTQERPQGGSTITQQVVKNLLVGNDLTFERKIREMVLAARVEKVLSKDEILELYLNFVFMGRASWGVDMAMHSYFNRSVRQATLSDASFLAALTRGPNFYNPDSEVGADRLKKRRKYVLDRMAQDSYITADQQKVAFNRDPELTPFEAPHTRAAYYFLDEIVRDARKQAGIQSLTEASYTVKSTIDRDLQRSTEKALQDGLANYEIAANRVGPFEREGSIANVVADGKVSWQDALSNVRAKLFDVQWTMATVLKVGTRSNAAAQKFVDIKVGLADGRTLPLVKVEPSIRQMLQPFDLVYVDVLGTGNGAYARLKIRPQVQGAVVVLEAKTGRVLAMTGGFSYGLSQLNRVTRSARQPGSTLKPFIYLSALASGQGYQPNTLLADAPVHLPPMERGGHWWSPKNYAGNSGGVVTIRHAIENSLNLPTVGLMSVLGNTPAEGLDYIRSITQELGIYKDTIRAYPFVLGAQPARLLDMAVAYATIANIGLKPTPHFVDTIEQNGKLVYERPRFSLKPLPSVDRVSFYQIRHILEGTVERGTAAKLKDLSGYIGAKTGTSNSENDAWFVGFTNDLVVATWVGYDSRKVRPSLGSGFTGAHVALPIAEQILRDSFKIYKAQELLQGPPAEIQSQIVEYPINAVTGQVGAGQYPEVFRKQGAEGLNASIATAVQTAVNGQTGAATASGDADSDETNADMFTDTDGIQDAVDQQAYVDQPTTASYDPGAEDLTDLWKKNPRKVDSSFLYLQTQPSN